MSLIPFGQTGRILTVKPNYRPTPKQMQIHNAPVSFNDICLTLSGGSRAGGKSAGTLGDAFLFATTYPGAKCMIVRENLSAVKQSFLDKLPNLFPQTVDGVQIYEYKEHSSSWYPGRSLVFPNGSYITFQRVANYAEAVALQGWEVHYLAIDELTKQDEKTFNYLLTLVRSAEIMNKYTGKPLRIPTKVVCGCNPGGRGHKWVKEKFIDTTVIQYDENNSPVRTKDYIYFTDNPVTPSRPIKTTVRFIPFSYRDNPYLSEAYIANLMTLPEAQKQRDVYGNWDIVSGKMFELKPGQLLNRFKHWEIMQKMPHDIYLSIDWGYNPDKHCCLWNAVFDDSSVITFKEMYGNLMTFEDFVDEIDKRSSGMDIAGVCLPHDMFRRGDKYRDTNGRVIGETKADVFESKGFNIVSVESGKGKVALRNDKIHSSTCMSRNSDNDTGEEPRAYKFSIFKQDCPNLVEEFENAVFDELDPSKIDDGCADHALDAYGLFLVYYSEDIAPIGFEGIKLDTRTKFQRRLDEEELLLEAQNEESCVILVDSLYDL